jgi:outer membrane protein assembly factor BamE (lipoprotein component of BamABCDE complex)
MIRKLVFAAAASALLASGCAPITAYHGFQAVEANPKDIKAGVDSKATVSERLGSPSAVASFEPNTWYYISAVTDQVAFRRPVTRKRDIVAISFSKTGDMVEKVDTFTLKDGRIISYNGRETPTRGREMTVLEQLLGNVGRSFIPNRDLDPGDPRGNNQ